MSIKAYATPIGFHTALEARLKNSATTLQPYPRNRQLLVYDRFLARIVTVFGNAATLKGGLALELRLERARSTQDVDLRVSDSGADVLSKLQQAGRLDLADFMTFEVQRDANQPLIQDSNRNGSAEYDGQRFKAECTIGGALYGQKFGVDVVIGEPMLGKPDVIEADDVLGFAGISPPKIQVYPPETHVAEKLHAYTAPRQRQNSRVKDLPDIALLASAIAFDAVQLAAALRQTFNFRKTHALPCEFPNPPPDWKAPYEALAQKDKLIWLKFDDVTMAAANFLNPVLAGTAGPSWSPTAWRWA